MSHRISRAIPMLLVCVAACAHWAARAQTDATLERYFESRSLRDVQAALLEDQLKHAAGSERIEIARQLAAVYIRLLDSTRGGPETSRWADRASSLLRAVPEAETPELTLELARSAYAAAEAVAERRRLRLADEQAIADAERTLRSVSPTFQAIAQRSHRLAERLESELGRQLDREQEEDVSARLAEARRLRSLGFYLAGWSELYLAEISGDAGHAEQALRRFGWLLGSGEGEPARLERFQPGLLQYEHIARAAVGAALACGLTGRAVEANAWLDVVERETTTAEAVERQMPARRAAVLAVTAQWRDLDTLSRRWLSPSEGKTDPALARLIAVVALEADRDGTAGQQAEMIRRVADAAIESLIAAGHLAHVVDLAGLYGPDRLGASGFVQAYVRGLLALEDASARTDQSQSQSDDAVTRVAFGEAGDRLVSAISEPDAGAYPRERAMAAFRAGQAFARANRIDDAVPLLEDAWRTLGERSDRESALWSLVAALDGAVDAGRDDLEERRDRAALVYLGEFAGSERAAMLALRPSTARLISSERAIELLLATPRGTASHGAAQRQASSLLYRAYRSAPRSERSAAAQRYIALAEVLIADDAQSLRSMAADDARAFAETVVLRCRRLADAALALSPPSLRAASVALETIERTAAFAGLDLGNANGEIAFRRLQLASARKDTDALRTTLQELEAIGGPYRAAAVRLLYRDAAEAWLGRPEDPGLASGVLDRGIDVLETLEEPRARAAVLAVVIEAAAVRWAAEREVAARDRGIDAGLELRAIGEDDVDSNRQTAILLEAAGRRDEALDAWRLVLAGSAGGTDMWFEARIESLELLTETDVSAARVAGQQFVALHPQLGPTHVRDRFRSLLARLGVAVTSNGRRSDDGGGP